MYKFYKIVIILFLNKAVFIKKNFIISIFCAKNRTTADVLFEFLEFIRLYHSQQCHHARDKLFPVCVRNIV